MSRKFIGFILSVFLPLFILAQENVNPADTVLDEKILKAFHKIFPDINPEEWVQQKDIYTITFFRQNKWYEVSINARGNWLTTSIIMDYESLPENLRNHFEHSKYNDEELVKVVEVENKDGLHYYELTVLDYHDNEFILRYSLEGQLIKIFQNE